MCGTWEDGDLKEEPLYFYVGWGCRSYRQIIPQEYTSINNIGFLAEKFKRQPNIHQPLTKYWSIFVLAG